MSVVRTSKLSKSDTDPHGAVSRKVERFVALGGFGNPGIHIAAVLAGAWAAPPSSALELAAGPSSLGRTTRRSIRATLIRYYAPEPVPTPVVTATIHYGDGRPDERVRLPERGVVPRLRYQRQLALANHLATDFRDGAPHDGDGARSAYARSYARHLAHARSGAGCVTVTLHLQSHLIPDPEGGSPRHARTDRRWTSTPRSITRAPERIGEFP